MLISILVGWIERWPLLGKLFQKSLPCIPYPFKTHDKLWSVTYFQIAWQAYHYASKFRPFWPMFYALLCPWFMTMSNIEKCQKIAYSNSRSPRGTGGPRNEGRACKVEKKPLTRSCWLGSAAHWFGTHNRDVNFVCLYFKLLKGGSQVIHN